MGKYVNLGTKNMEIDIEDEFYVDKSMLNDAPRPKGRGIGAFGSSSGLDSGSSAEI